jgi:signal transduction histidine kinase
VTGHLASINEQARAATRLLGQPELVAPSLASIRETSDSVLTEMHSTVRLLQGDGRPDSAEPAPGLGRLPELLAELSAAGLAVEHQVRGEPRQLPATADQAAYRIVGEALAGAQRLGVRAARLTLRYRPGALEIEMVSTAGNEFRMRTQLSAEKPADATVPAPACNVAPRGRVRPA